MQFIGQNSLGFFLNLLIVVGCGLLIRGNAKQWDRSQLLGGISWASFAMAIGFWILHASSCGVFNLAVVCLSPYHLFKFSIFYMVVFLIITITTGLVSSTLELREVKRIREEG